MDYQDIMDSGKVFKILNGNERQVLKLRFGFEDGVARSQDEVSALIKVSKSRVSQIEARAKEKINLILQYNGKQPIQ
jgi:DNA-directed RNA polymerase sigma subunit (sigma70/sigma32)